jgi:hypothetical protein
MKKRLSALGLVILLCVSSANAFAASPAKPGAKCAKANQTQVVGNKKFTCTKSGSKLTWNKGVTVPRKATPSATASAEPSASPLEATPSASAASSSAPALVKFKNCTEAKAAGAAPLTKAKTPELYELNSGLDRDKDGVACES